MKKIAYFSIAALALLACQREVDLRVEERIPTHTVTLQAGLQAQTKTTYTEEGKFSWAAGDQIGVLVTNGQDVRQVSFTTQDAKPIATFTGEVPDGFTVADFASYPFTGVTEDYITNDFVYVPSAQGWSLSQDIQPDLEHPLAAIPLIGTKDVNGFFQFKTAVGIVRFTVENVPKATTHVELQAEGNAALAGVFQLNDKGVVAMDKGLSPVACVANHNAPAEKNTTMDFFFFVPEGSLPEGSEFHLCSGADVLQAFPFKKAVEVAVNRIVNVAPIVLEPEPLYDRQSDSLALVVIYNIADGANWKASRKWELEKPMSDWPGIKLNDEGRVIEMSITNGTVSTVEWEIPAELADLTEVKTLQIVGSKLKGSIPDFFYDMTQLEKVRFNTNNLTGELSEKLGQLTNLLELYLNGNKELGGSLPASIGELKKLGSINIAQTAIGGAIPQELVGCEALANFMAYETQLSGQVPDFWDQFQNIGVLQLYNNPGLEGPLPASCGRATTTAKTYSLRFDGCNFTGNIPESYATLPAQCKQFFAKGNKLSGVVPAGVQAHANWTNWKAAENILPQQDGYGLTLKPAPSRQLDSLALVAIYNASKGAEWAKNKWDLSKPMDEWNGITLTEGRVTVVKITTASTITEEWTLPDEVGDLTELTDFRINGNKLTGAIPEAVFTLPKLQKLYLQNNNVTGELSSKLGDLTELTEFYIDRNTNLGGSIPAAIGQLKKLVSINISKTGIGGAIPQELVGCEALANFMAYETQLSGQVPDFWDQFQNIGVLQLYNNPGLEGPLPASCGRATTTAKTYSLRFDGCNFTGNIPESYATLPSQCKQFWAKGNKLSGVVPAGVQAHANWTNWKAAENILPQQEGYGLTLKPAPSRQLDSLALVAIYNAADGANWKEERRWDLSTPIDQWDGVTVTDDRVTKFQITAASVIPAEWTMPHEVGDLTELTVLKVNQNKLAGEIPEELYSLTKLTDLWFQNDNLSGSISEKVGQLTELKNFYIDRNTNLGGSIPATIGQLTKLVSINISKTGIGGAIPQELVGCEALANFMAYETQLSGQVPDFWDQFQNIGVLQLYNNPGLEGPLPASCGHATTTAKTYSLRFDGCNFTGNIPESYATLPAQCKQFFAKGNKLSGVVPAGVQAHANWTNWKAAENILPQQEGYGLTLE